MRALNWDRRQSLSFRVLPYALLTVSVLVTLFTAPRNVSTVLVLSAVAGVWVLAFHTLRPQWHVRRGLAGVYYLGLLGLAGALVAIAPWYGFFCFVGYPQAFEYLSGRWRYAGAAATAVVSSVAFLGGVAGIRAEGLWWAWLGVALVSTVLALALFSFFEMTEERSVQQRRALVELRELNTRLELALAENAELQAELLVTAREAGVLDERQRMAREIHDTLAQGLAGILTQLQAADLAVEDRPTLHRHLASATELARESLTEARRSVHAVEPSVLAHARLPEAIGDVARRWSQSHHVDAVLTTTGDARPMHTEVEIALLRTAQEALTNVAKHARAGRVGLTLSYMEDVVTLDVRDDGIGFDPALPHRGGFGLAGMRQRVQRLAGRLAVESEPGGGTAVSATVPALPVGGGR